MGLSSQETGSPLNLCWRCRARRLVSGHLGPSRSLGAQHPQALTGRGDKCREMCQNILF